MLENKCEANQCTVLITPIYESSLLSQMCARIFISEMHLCGLFLGHEYSYHLLECLVKILLFITWNFAVKLIIKSKWSVGNRHLGSCSV